MISAVFVSYRSAGLAAAAIESFRAEVAGLPGGAEVIVVVTSEDPSERDALASHADRAILMPRNAGFSGGLNAGLDVARGEILFLAIPTSSSFRARSQSSGTPSSAASRWPPDRPSSLTPRRPSSRRPPTSPTPSSWPASAWVRLKRLPSVSSGGTCGASGRRGWRRSLARGSRRRPSAGRSWQPTGQLLTSSDRSTRGTASITRRTTGRDGCAS